MLVLFGTAYLAAQRSISGRVTDANGEALIGTSILVKGTAAGTVTDLDGSYNLSAPAGATTLVFSYTGFRTQEVPLGASNIVDVVMELDAIGLETAVVVAYGTQSNRYKVQSTSQIGEDAIRNVPVIGPQQLLQGQAAGVQMVNASGVLGAPATVRIRGVASINAGGSPLYVVDGVPLNDGEYSLGGGAPGVLNPLQDINPNDIESLTVLKDAAAAAIYGSRGSNGVIIITTKKGKAGSNRVSADVFTGWSQPTYLLDMMSADEFRTFMKDYNNNSTFPETSFDWVDAVRQTGRINSYTVNFSGGTDKTQFYVSGSFLDQTNYAIGNELDRYNGRINFKHTISDRFRLGANIGLSRTNNDRINSDNSTFAPLTSAYLQLPTVEPRDANGAYTNTGFIANVLAIEDLSTRFLITDRTTANGFLAYDLLKGLTLRSEWGVDRIGTDETIRDPNIVSPGGYGYNRVISDNKWLTTNTLAYERESGNHAISLLAGISYETSLQKRTAVEGRNFASDDLPNVASASTPTLTFSDRTEWALASQFFRANYRLNNRYILEGSLRRDGSSRFGAENRWGVFWAGSVGWLVTEENFMKNVSFIDNLKLTLSYGVSGNDRIGNFPSLGLYGSGVGFDYTGLPGVGPTQAPNPDLKWEETAQLDFGVSVAILDSRVSIDFNYYVKQTSDLLLPFQLPDVNGLSVIDRNAGEMENRGIDLTINTVNVNRRDFQWRTSLNLGFLQNEVTALPGASLDPQGRPFIQGTNEQRAIVGHSANTFFLVEYIGVNPETGNAEWRDLNGNPVTVLSPANRIIAGSAIPDLTGGLNNTLTYKGFDLNFLFNFSYGNEVFLNDLTFTENPVTTFNKSRILLDYWTESNRDAFAPGSASTTKNQFASASTLQMLDGSFLRLRNLSLGYTLRGSKLGTRVFESARVYVMGQNLWTLRAKEWEGRGQDPEISDAGGANNLRQGQSFFTPPQARMITVGLTATF
jgi:TonB-linked SusC/RagA family outer membrane protein